MRRLLVIILGFALLLGAAADARARLRMPADPLRSTVGLSFGVLDLDSEAYRAFFEEDVLTSWTLRYDYRVWSFFRLGAALSATTTSKHSRDVSIESEAYPIRFSFSAFQGMGELYLRAELPEILAWRPHLGIGALLSRVHAESEGYADGYDAIWEEYRPAAKVVQLATGWRAALGLQRPFWANLNLFVEGSRIELDRYAEPLDQDPPVGSWDHSGWRLEAGLLQRF